MKKVVLIVIRIMVVAVIAALIEVFVINMPFFIKSVDSSVKRNIMISTDDFTYYNWIQVNGEYVSEFDPIIVYENINTYVESVKIYVDYEGSIPYTDIFYINEDYPIPCEQTCLHNESELTCPAEINVDLGVEVNGLRIDLGDEAGLKLNSINVIVNENTLTFSWARFIAINMIYWIASFLFAAQRPPKYNI
ncbi:MAG: hypothetical protein J6C22_18675 [Bacteroides sp.]|nr:hypothetical protein [Bacteroides sp.]